ncbi:MAG: hypothetical protein C0483_22410 [Pirellula sp.]|nr:hypothetical protein [Pirellula sp.]
MVTQQHRGSSSTPMGRSVGAPQRAGTTFIVVLQSGASRNGAGLFNEHLSAPERLPIGAHDDATILQLPIDSAASVSEILKLLRSRFGSVGLPAARGAELQDLPRYEVHAHVAERLLRFDELLIDLPRREVRVDGRSIVLTKSEFDLLAVLADQPGIVFTRREIVLAYKGLDYPVDDRSIDVQMVNLRRKLGRAANRLQTIRGVGYRFVADSALGNEEVTS